MNKAKRAKVQEEMVTVLCIVRELARLNVRDEEALIELIDRAKVYVETES